MLTFLENFSALTWQMVVMWIIGGVLIFLAIKKTWNPRCFCLWALARYWSTCPIRARLR